MMNAATQSLQSQSEKSIAESHHIDISTDRYNDGHSNMSTDGHINFAKDVADEEIKDSHTNISTDGYVDDAQCEYKVVPVDEDMSTNDHFQEQSCENNTMEEPSAVEEPTIFEDAAEASTIATDLVNHEAVESTTPGENFCSEDEIVRIIDDPLNHPNAPDDAQVELKPYTPHIKFVDVNDANKFSVVIFVDMAAEKEESCRPPSILLTGNHCLHNITTALQQLLQPFGHHNSRPFCPQRTSHDHHTGKHEPSQHRSSSSFNHETTANMSLTPPSHLHFEFPHCSSSTSEHTSHHIGTSSLPYPPFLRASIAPASSIPSSTP
ncbi:hypothetical protein DEO72_LG7g1392 [Vigna unguiculata]|uniref:Uncharacterized protein n=1 Tax=Vigna unguiculata TaxID=3917 RepID=A0A4D6MFG1_VIGUN|nr:hypothetical protein DEO72_LG7g1392 [Vigna unguiculata]